MDLRAHTTTRHYLAAAAIATGSGGGVGGIGGSSGGGGGGGGWGGGAAGPPRELALVATNNEPKTSKPIVLTLASFAVTRKAYTAIIKRFMRDYEAATGQAVRFQCAYAGSGTQARAVIDGLPADIVALALPLDVQKIAESGLINSDWQKRLPNNAIVCTSVVAIVFRPGNPKNIQGWNDLERPDVSVITANPKTAGVARWNFLALWGHRAKQGDKAATNYCTNVFKRVVIQPRDAREASDTFLRQSIADVLLTYENEIVLTNTIQPSSAMPYIAPDNNVLIENPVAVIDRNVDKRGPEVRAAAEAFVRYLFTPVAQREFAACGFRSVDKSVAADTTLPKVNKLWRVEDKLGSWNAVQKQFFGDKGVLDRIQNEVGEYKLEQQRAKKRSGART